MTVYLTIGTTCNSNLTRDTRKTFKIYHLRIHYRTTFSGFLQYNQLQNNLWLKSTRTSEIIFSLKFNSDLSEQNKKVVRLHCKKKKMGIGHILIIIIINRTVFFF